MFTNTMSESRNADESLRSSDVLEIRKRAEAIAVKLVMSDLRSSDPALAPLCAKLERYRKLLMAPRPLEQLRTLLRSGFDMVKFSPGSGTVDQEAVRLLESLIEKLGPMASAFGIF